MSSSFLPQFFFRRDGDGDHEDTVEPSSSADYSFDLGHEEETENRVDSAADLEQVSQLLEYSDTDDDDHVDTGNDNKPSKRWFRSVLSDEETASDVASSSNKYFETPNTHTNTSNWIQQLAYAFRPGENEQHRQPPLQQHAHPHHRRVPSMSSRDSPRQAAIAIAVSQHHKHNSNNTKNEKTPLLQSSSSMSSSSKQKGKNNNLPFYVSVAAAFLKDYEANRPPSLSKNLNEISPYQVYLHHIKFSGWVYSINLCLASLALFVSSLMEGQTMTLKKRLWMTGLNLYAVCVLAVDLWIRQELRPYEGTTTTGNRNNNNSSSRKRARREESWDPNHGITTSLPSSSSQKQRDSRSGHLAKPLIVFMVVLTLETLARFALATFVKDKQQQQQYPMILISSILKPLVLFYVSGKARDALAALRRILKTVASVLLMEMLIILMFAAIACRLFADFDRFHNLPAAWLSLFELATTVVNPSIWLPMYNVSKYSALFFVFYIVTTVFYLHSLVLSVVFQTYLIAASEIHERGVTDREEAVHLSYLALKQFEPQRGVIATESVRQLLCFMRPHYNAHKINALLEIVDPNHQMSVDYPTYRARIRQALNASIRTARTASTVAMSVELIAVFVAVVNLIYVLVVSSSLNSEWFNDIQGVLGCIITVVATLELVIRFNPLRISDFTPLTRLNTTFDGLAVLGAFISAIGIVLLALGTPNALEFILMGRSVDIFRVMRFFPMFRDIVHRSADVLPVLLGPIILVLTTLHIFNYVGMTLWGGAIDVGGHSHEIERYYDLNNFNSYEEGIVTMFQLLVVNDWHAIAEVFFYANRCSSPFFVVPFFVSGNVIGVSIMLNVMTAFFVQAFVAKVDDDHHAISTSAANPQKAMSQSQPSDFSIKTSENSTVRRICSSASIHDQTDGGADADSEGSSESDFLEFDVYEREGFDKIMQTVAGYEQSHLAEDVRDYLEVYEKLAPDREPVGFLICDQLTMERFSNRRFQSRADGFLDINQLHVVVSDMHSELLALSSRMEEGRSLIRTFSHHGKPNESLEITAALLRRHPAISIFVSRRRTRDS